jgi:two-component system sensor histidine kinase ChvG
MASATRPPEPRTHGWRGALGRALAHLVRIRYRLLLVNVMVVAVPLLGVGFARTFEREMLRSLEDDMIHQAQLVRAALAHEAGPGGLAPAALAARTPMLREAARHTRTRIRLLDAAGRVVADSHGQGPPEGAEAPAPSVLGLGGEEYHPPETPEPLDVAGRDEVRAARAGRYGAATRLWENRSRMYLFSALPIFDTPSGSAPASGAGGAATARVAGVVYVTRSTAPVKFAMFRLRTWLLWVLAAAVVTTAILSLFLAATIARPLGRLGRIAGRIAAGDRSQRLALERRDEIGELARAFDAMAQRLDERVQYTRALAADISHEFKSPLTSIRGAAELLRDGAADDPPARERFLGNIVEDTQRLDRLVTRLLELSRIEAEVAPAEIFDYEALVREVVERRREQAEISVGYHSKTTQMHGRRSHIASALGNLLDNAVQHHAPGSVISVHVSDAPGGMLRTAVSNRGPAISQAVMARIWDRFFTTRAKQGGTGLGLAIVASIARAHGGAVAVASTAEDGTTFSFDVPRG